MTGANRGFAVGAVSAFVYRINGSNIATGNGDPDNLTVDTTYHAQRLPGIISIALPSVSYETAVDRGDQSILGQLDLGPSDFGTFDIQISNESADLKALLGDSVVDQATLSNAYISSPNPGLAAPPVVGIMFTTYFQSRDTATEGATKYRTYIFPSCQVRYQGGSASQDGGTNPNPVTLTCTPSQGSTFPGGNAFSATQGWTNNKTLYYDIVADKPFALTAYVANGVATSYILAYLPATSEVGATDHIFTVNGTVTAPSSVSTATGVVTLAAAGSSNDVDVAVYQVTADFQTP